MSPSELALTALGRIKRFGGTGWGRTRCPFCPTRRGTEDKRGSFSVNGASGFFHCFRCAVKGRLTQHELDSGGVVVDISAAPALPEPGSVALGPPAGFAPLAQRVGSVTHKPFIDYLERRGVHLATVDEAHVGAVVAGRLAGRIVVPIRNSEGKWAGWSARRVAVDKLFDDPLDALLLGAGGPPQQGPKYLYPPGMARATLMYNEAAIWERTETPLMVVEGVFDALPYWPAAVAVLGKPSEGQIERLQTATRPLAVVLDGDAWEEGEMLALRLAFEGARAWSVKLPPVEDPGSVEPGWLLEQVNRAAPGQ